VATSRLLISTQRNDDWIYRDELVPITDDNGDTIFGNEVQPKPTSPGHDYGRSSPNRNTSRSRSRQYAAFPCESVAMSSWLQQQPPLIFMRRLGLQSMTQTLPYTAKYNSSPIVTGLYKYSTQYLTSPKSQSSLSGGDAC
jgi:hypothetical protein